MIPIMMRAASMIPAAATITMGAEDIMEVHREAPVIRVMAAVTAVLEAGARTLPLEDSWG